MLTTIWKTLYSFKRWILDRVTFSPTPIAIFTSLSHSFKFPIQFFWKLVHRVHDYNIWRNLYSNTPSSSNRKSCIYNGSIVICDTEKSSISNAGNYQNMRDMNIKYQLPEWAFNTGQSVIKRCLQILTGQNNCMHLQET